MEKLIMSVENQVCSLELAKRLKELGVTQLSLCYWWQYDKDAWDITINVYPTSNSNYISAFTVAELGEMLPDWTETAKRLKDDWVCIVMDKNSDNNWNSFDATEANARAKMLIYLIENGLIN